MLEIIAIVFIMSSCDPADNRLKLVNNSNTDIYFFYSCDTLLNNLDMFKSGYYYDSKGDSTYISSNHFIEKKTFRNIPNRGFNAWKHYLNNCKDQKIYFFIFNDSIVSKYSYDEIRDKRLFEKCLIYTLNDLKQNNWTITYP